MAADRTIQLVDLLEEWGVPFVQAGEHHHSSVGWINVDCSQCSPGSERYRLGIHLASQTANCWSCGPVDTSRALADLSGVGWGAVRAILRRTDRPDDVTTRRSVGKLQPPKGVQALTERHRTYLTARGFDPDEITRLWGVQAVTGNAQLGTRLYLPIVYHGQTVSWTSRDIMDGTRWERPPRYKTAAPHQEAVHHKSILYGMDYVRHAVIVCEGPIDVWRVGPGAVATFGFAFTQEQAALISRYPIRVICYDTEEAGQKRRAAAQRAAQRLCWLLESVPGRTYRVQLNAADPGSATDQEIKELRQRFLE